MIRAFWLLAITILVSSCTKVYDQKLAKSVPALNEAVNEKPTKRNFLENNAKHKLLLAVVDSGVDYNHPLLANHIHFELNADGEPIGAGFDFVGDDAWASPYIANTLPADTELAAKYKLDQDKRGIDKAFTSEAKKLISEKMDAAERLIEAAQKSALLAKHLNSSRAYMDEIDNTAGHGTHVAGLASYDDEAIGILPVRVLPSTNIIGLNEDKKNDAIAESEEIVFERIYKGIEYSIQKGARVINLSLGVTQQIEGNQAPSIDYQKIKVFAKKLEDLMKANPNVVAVAAAGNDGKWLDQDSVYNFPCGINAPNVLCVGALKADGKLSSFTNIPLKRDVNIIYASGVDIYSSYPQKMCTEEGKKAFDETDIDKFSEIFMKECTEGARPKMVKMSGTSMASPIVARMVAKVMLANPEVNGKEAIDLLMKKTDTADSEDLRISLNKLKVKAPSWYEDKFLVPNDMAVYSLGITMAAKAILKDNWVNLWIPTPSKK